MKKLLTFTFGLVCGSLIFILATSVFAANNDRSIKISYRDIKLTINGKTLTPKDAAGNVVEPFIYNGTTYLPVRAVGEAAGFAVSWNGTTSTVALSSGTLSNPQTPLGSGGAVVKGGNSEIDTASVNNAYIRARYTTPTSKRVKVTISNGSKTYSYDLSNQGVWETYPLQSGSGKYTVKVMENIENTRYAVKQTLEVNAAYSNANAPYLIPIQLINYSETSKVVKKAAELCSGKSGDLAKVEACYKYVVDTIKYDYDKAKQVTNGQLTGYIPNVDVILGSKKGICFDYSSVLAAMLRSQGIPAKLAMGYVPSGSDQKTYHAWNEVYISGQGWIKLNTSIYFDGKNWSRMDSTFAASGAANMDSISYAKDKEY